MRFWGMKSISRIVMLLLAIATLVSCSRDIPVLSLNEKEAFALYNCTIIDGTGAEPIEDSVILIRKDRIEKVGKSQDIEIPKEYVKKNMKGAYILPGFINSHVHYAYDEAKLKKFLQGGVTTVRDLNPINASDPIKLRNRFNKNNQFARLVAATPMLTAPGGYGSMTVNSPEDAKQTVEQLVDEGYDVVKLAIEDYCNRNRWEMLPPENITAIVKTAHEKNKWVAVHITRAFNLDAALDNGINEISHMVIDGRVDEKAINRMVKQDVYWVPTLELWSGITKRFGIPYEEIAVYNLSRFYKAGGKVALGTDFMGFSMSFDNGFPIKEVKLMQEAGMSNMDIIVAGTMHAAKTCDMAEEIGTLEAGKIADIVVVEGNPLEDIRVLTKPSIVIHNGTVAYVKEEAKK